MKKILPLLFLTCQLCIAQQTSFKGHELYATVKSIKDFDFGFAYKHGLTNEWYLRFDVLNMGISKRKMENATMQSPTGQLLNVSKQADSKFDLGVGIERRTVYHPRMEILYGLSLIGGMSNQTTEAFTPDDLVLTDIEATRFSYGAGLHLGTLVNISPQLWIGAEVMPQYLRFKDKTEYGSSTGSVSQTQTTTGSTLHLSFNDVRFSLVYRFRR